MCFPRSMSTANRRIWEYVSALNRKYRIIKYTIKPKEEWRKSE